MVVNKVDDLTTECSCPDKFKESFFIEKSPDGYATFSIRPSSGPKPKVFEGRFTSEIKALDVVVNYIFHSPMSKATRRDKNYRRLKESREQRENATKVLAESK